jgi:hypothetical protein
VQLARADRRREDGDGDGCPACVGSGGAIGWQDAGTGPTGNEYVRPCPGGCKPPRFGHTFRRDATAVQGELVVDPAQAQANVRRLAAELKAALKAGKLTAGPRRPATVGAEPEAYRRPAAAAPHPHDSDF